MTFTKRFLKATRRKKRVEGRQKPGGEAPSRAQLRRMTSMNPEIRRQRIWATAAPLRESGDIGKVGLWAWKEGESEFRIAGDAHPRATALGTLQTICPGAEVIPWKQFYERTKHLRAAAATNGHTKEEN